MSGGATEYIATNIKNTSGYLNIYGLSIMNATSEYKDVYTAGVPDTRANNYDLAMNKKGDALYETSTKLLSGPTWATAWYGDSSSIASESPAWFSRGRCL